MVRARARERAGFAKNAPGGGDAHLDHVVRRRALADVRTAQLRQARLDRRRVHVAGERERVLDRLDGPEMRVHERRARAAPAQRHLAGHRVPAALRGERLVRREEDHERAERVSGERTRGRLAALETEHELRGDASGPSASSAPHAQTQQQQRRRGAPAHLHIWVVFRQHGEHEVLEVRERGGLLVEGPSAAFPSGDASGVNPARSGGRRECQSPPKRRKPAAKRRRTGASRRRWPAWRRPRRCPSPRRRPRRRPPRRGRRPARRRDAQRTGGRGRGSAATSARAPRTLRGCPRRAPAPCTRQAA